MTNETRSNPSIQPLIAAAKTMLTSTMLMLVLSLALSPAAKAGEVPLTISGTVEYTGSQGPISAGNPILLFLVSNPTLDEIPVDATMVDTNGGAFELTAPEAGFYQLVYLVDTNGDALPAVGDPFQLYDGVLQPPQTDLALSFDDTDELPGVRGTATYTGSMGPVDADHPIRVDVYRNGDLTDRLLQRQELTNNGDSYQFLLLDNPLRVFFLQAYLDLNDNDSLDDGEPFTIYDNRMEPPGDALPHGVVDVDLSFGDGPEPTVTPGGEAIVSGTIEYTGARGPVSGSRPIIMILSASPNFDGAPSSFAVVDTNGGAFELQAPAPGDYYLAYLLDTNGDGTPEVGDPFEIYLDHGAAPGDPVTAPQSDLVLSFDDTNGLPGVEGTVTYTGARGPVSNEMPIIVEAFRDADLTDRLDQPNRLLNNGDPYAFLLLEDHAHYVRAFLDLDNNFNFDEGEPFTIYDGKSAPPGDPIPQDGSMVDISFGDENAATPTPTPTPTQTSATPESTPTPTVEGPTPTPTVEGPLTISGTVQYNGSQGPVSAAKPIVVFATRSNVFDGIPVDIGLVEVNGGAFELTMPEPGEYYLAYLLDTNGDSIPAIGDPYRLYDNRLYAPADPITVPVNEAQSNLMLVFDDTVGLSGLFGTVTYTGSMGPVDETRPIRVQVFREGDLTDRVDREQRLVSNGASYSFIVFESRLHFMQVFLDLNDNDVLDPGEPYEIYPDRFSPPGEAVPQDVEVDVSFGDAPPTPTPIEGPTLSGTIEYTGSRGPVSGERPILLFLLPAQNLDGQPVSATFVDTNGGAFELAAPEAGDYYLAYLLDTNGDQAPAVGDPFEVYLDRTTVPGDPVTVPQSGLALSFDDSGTLPGIQGTATYTGSLGPVSTSRPILVDVYRDADLTDRLDQQSVVVSDGDPFDFILLEGGDFYLMAFLDLNQNDVRDEGEPYTIYNGRAAPPGDPIPSDGTILDIIFGDEPGPTPTSTPTVTPTPETPCVGDCDGDGEVTIDELVLGASIALGATDVTQCPAFDLDDNGIVTIDEVVQAVANSIGGCPGN